MKKKSTLTEVSNTLAAAAAAVSAKESGSSERDEMYSGSAINLRKSDWRMLRRVAEARVDAAGGGRPSVSKVIERLIADNRESLQSEIE